jgi:hypothetical protein
MATNRRKRRICKNKKKKEISIDLCGEEMPKVEFDPEASQALQHYKDIYGASEPELVRWITTNRALAPHRFVDLYLYFYLYFYLYLYLHLYRTSTATSTSFQVREPRLVVLEKRAENRAEWPAVRPCFLVRALVLCLCRLRQ